MSAYVNTIVKGIIINDRAVKIVEVLPNVASDLISVGKIFSSQKFSGLINSYVYVEVRAHETRVITVASEQESASEPGPIQRRYERRMAELKAESTQIIEDFESEEKEIVIEEVPELELPAVPHFYVSEENAEIFGLAHASLKANPQEAFKILVVGGSGYGKTSMAQRFAKVTGMDCIRMNCASVTNPEEWFGYRVAEEGSTKFVPSAFIEAVVKGSCVVILDEFNRLESWLTNTMYPLLDHDQSTVIMNERFTVGPNVLFVATANIGYNFTGTFATDTAMTNRFDAVARVGDIPSVEEVKVLTTSHKIKLADAESVVRIANVIRTKGICDCSIRSTLKIARLISHGSTVRSAFEHSLVTASIIDGNSAIHKNLLDIMNTQIGVYAADEKMSFNFSM